MMFDGGGGPPPICRQAETALFGWCLHHLVDPTGLLAEAAGCDHLNRPHRDHLTWPHMALGDDGVHLVSTGGLESGTHGNEVEGGTVRGDPQSECRTGRPVDS